MPHPTPRPRSLLITGASSGIGAALALEYAERGTFLALSGRDRRRLEDVAAACRRRGADVAWETVDVTDRPAMARWCAAVDRDHPLDLVIANAGISGGTGSDDEDAEKVRAIFAVNVTGVINTVLPVIPLMRSRGRGHIALMGSLAAFRGLMTAPAYSASKAAVKNYGEALRPRLAADGIAVSVILPGFVKTPMSAANRFRTPLLMPVGRAARIIRRGLARNQGRIAFPWPAYAAAWLLGVLPPAVGDWIVKRAPRKT